MNTLTHRQLPPSPRDAAIARSSRQVLSHYAGMAQPLRLRVSDGGQERPIELPAGAVDLLMHVLEAMSVGAGRHTDSGRCRADDGSGGRRAERLPTLPDQATRPESHPAPEGRQAPPHSHGRCHGIQGCHRPGARAGSRPVDPRGPGSGHGIWSSVTRVTAEQAAQEVRRQETAIGAHRLEFLVGTRHLGQCLGSARSG